MKPWPISSQAKMVSFFPGSSRNSSPSGPQVAKGGGLIVANGDCQELLHCQEIAVCTNQSFAYSSSDDGIDSGSEEGEGCPTLDNLEDTIFKGYLGTRKIKDELPLDPGFLKIRDLLVASRVGGLSCLICLEKIRVTDPIWDCKAGCHAVFHSICIQAWARQASTAAAERATSRLSRDHFPAAVTEAARTACWHCPKCRIQYTQSEIPREYKCFCGKVVEPVPDPWLTPHSCGEICGRSLPSNCGHECTLLCHPGPCPSCPQFVKVQCFCGSDSDVRRCGRKEFSCGRSCGKRLSCTIHECEQSCHAGPCPPCQKIGSHHCRCGRVLERRACIEADFQCEEPCGRQLSCKKHWCKKICHSGPCGECELQGRRTCPCAKVDYNGMACDVTAPTCGSTCEKMLQCSIHRCQERCHYSSCNSTCRIVTTKVCRCRSMRKEVPCYQDLQCERKCQRMRGCTRHPCKRRCCDGDCPPCYEVCGRKLRCFNHKCPAPCHRGACTPCPVTVRISCACGATYFDVPCGTEKVQKPPRCSKRCLVPPHCRHRVDCKPHRCHYGACPPCQLICNEELPCGHKCKERCHGPRPPLLPEYTLKPKKKKGPEDAGQNLGSPCPLCSERVIKPCLGRHPGGERTVLCSESFEFECGELCQNPLACGNHSCQNMCHKVTVPRGDSSGIIIDASRNTTNIFDNCGQCPLTCQKKRVPYCPHPCMQACHSGDCPPCSVLIKRTCYCGTLVHAFECSWFNSLTDNDRRLQLSCGGPCHRKLPNCTHLCSEICHEGPCTAVSTCRKRVTVRCECQRLKKEWTCSDVQAAYNIKRPALRERNKGSVGVGLLSCDEECLRMAEQQALKHADGHIQQRERAVSELYDLHVSKVPKRRRQHGSGKVVHESFNIKDTSYGGLRGILLVVFIVLLAFIFYSGYRGLLTVSNWMNELDAKRPRKRPPGSLVI